MSYNPYAVPTAPNTVPAVPNVALPAVLAPSVAPVVIAASPRDALFPAKVVAYFVVPVPN